MKPKKKKKQQAQQLQASTFRIPFDPPVVDDSAFRTIPYVIPPDNMYGEDLSTRAQAVMPFIQELYSMPSVRQKIAESMNRGYGSDWSFEEYMDETKDRVKSGDYSNPQQVAFMRLLDMYPNSNVSSYNDMAELYAKHMSDPMSYHIRTGPPRMSRDVDDSLGYIIAHDDYNKPGSNNNPMYMGLGHIMNRGNYASQVDDDAPITTIAHEATHAGDPYVFADRTDRNSVYLSDNQFRDDVQNFRSRYIDPYAFSTEPPEKGSLDDRYRDQTARSTLRYYNKPTEVLARLNEIRYLLKDRAIGQYTEDDLLSIPPANEDWNPLSIEDIKHPASALKELRTLYSDEQILQMLNELY